MIAQRSSPKTAQDVAALLGQCNERGQAVGVEGGNTLHGLGAVTRAYDVRLRTTGLSGLVAHEFADLTCSVRAGTTLGEFASALAKHGQFVPIDAPAHMSATVGGTLAAGWLGPRRHFYGRARDFVIGSEAVLADGTIAHAGGMVVKNVSGYDMSKLYVGSFGTLAVITQVNFKTLPVAARARSLIAKLPEGSRARVAAQISALAIVPAAACCIEGFRKTIAGEDGVDGRLFLLLEGSPQLLDRATREVRSALGRAGVPDTVILDTGVAAALQSVLDAEIASLGERSLTYRSFGMPETVHERATAMRDAANAQQLFTDVLFDLMNGDVFVRVSERDSRAFTVKVEACHDGIRAIDPSSTIVAGDAPIRTSLDAWGQPPPAIEKMKALKARFDPNGILNPGRFVGGI